jgi:hypothetical protein
LSKKQFLTIEDRFRELPPEKYPFTDAEMAEELGKPVDEAKRMIKAYSRQSEKALWGIEGNHVTEAPLFDQKTEKLEKVGRYVILKESWRKGAKWVRASWGLYIQHAWKIHNLGVAMEKSAFKRYAVGGIDVSAAIESSQKLLDSFKPLAFKEPEA